MDDRYPLAYNEDSSPRNQHEVLDRFLEYVANKKLALYESQEEAILELYAGHNVILNTPTGSGKSLVATALHYYSICMGRRSVYTSPVKALVNEKFMALCHEFGPEQVGLITGDASVNRKAPIICCTAEILANISLREGDRAVLHDVIMDEFHYYADRERGVAWQIPLLTLPQCRFLLMSATLGDTSFFSESLTKLNERKTVLVSSAKRPVPLDFAYVETPLNETINDLLQQNKAPIYIVNFTQREAAQTAQNFLSMNFCSKEEKKQINETMQGTQFTTPFGKEIKKLLQHGIGLHHAGLLPKYRILVESMAQKGLLKLICGTDTLGVGVNIPIRTVIFTQLCKFDGEKTTLLSVRDFHQIAGRAGRKGFDSKGWVIAQAPAHVIENLKLERKAKLTPKKKFVKVKPPTKGYVAYNEETFEKLVNSPPEKLTSQFQVSHAMLIHVLGRSTNGCRAMKHILRDCHESSKAKEHLSRQAMQLFRALVERKIVEFIPPEERVNTPIRVNVDLQEDFSLNQTLGLFLLDSLIYIDPMLEDYDLVILTLIESILENPQVILRQQLEKLKRQRLSEMKAEGLEYEERIAELENLEYPKPMADYIYDTFNRYVEKHPWIGQENIRPKSIAREMYENYHSFNEYIKLYGLERVEGILLRYLSSVYKVLVQTVPDHLKNDAIDEMTTYFETMLENVDSSIFDEWKKLKDPTYTPKTEAITQKPEDITQIKRLFIIQIRNHIFQLVRYLANQDFEALREQIVNKNAHHLSDEALQAKLEVYQIEHEKIRLDPKARNPAFTTIHEGNPFWTVDQILVDPAEHNDWLLRFHVDIAQSREKNAVVLSLEYFGDTATLL